MPLPDAAQPVRPERRDREAELHSLLDERYSPRAYTPEPVTDEELTALLEAARWAPSWGNAQSSRFVVARAGTPGHERLVGTLTRGNLRWAPAAPVLLLAVASTTREDGTDARHAAYDLGQAVAHLTVQAAALGLAVHQMAGFDSDRAREAAGVPEGFEPYTVVAIGHAGDAATLEDEGLREREIKPRERIPLAELAFTGRWGEPWGG